MPRVKTTVPDVSREKGQRSLDLSNMYLSRILPQWKQPDWLQADAWRYVVANQPFATICREAIIQRTINLDWKIDARDANRRDELKSDIDYYTKLLSNDGSFDWMTRLDWILQDYLDLPFGAACEIGRDNDSPDGKVVWIEPLDGGTLFPYPNKKYPVGQALHENVTDMVFFPYYAINRMYMSPRTKITRWGWGCAPPEKIYLSLELLNRGDYYYANLLVDTPEVGILDLGNIAADSAKAWLESWKTMLAGVDPFKVPVLYEHDTPASFISFSRSPTELMFDKATLKYAGICCAGYGLSLSDVGIQAVSSGGDTLAGSIRNERKSRITGFGRAKKAAKLFFDRIINPELSFKFIDMDDEVSVALGRARLATATALSIMIDKRAITPQESRLQMLADGLIDVPIPEEIPKDGFDDLMPKINPAFGNNGNSSERPGLLGRPIAPSQGGWGERKSEALQLALLDDGFANEYTYLENHWDELTSDVQELAVKEIDEYLDSLLNPLQEDVIIEE